ncbi:hypothetical protein DL768_006496 [Monosporascus sp. mg162]|nr:hypothetical protein DL768_006496 [Monosporascus sp. mg162]
MADQRPEPLRLGSVAPNFKAETTAGPIDFHEFVGDKWVVFFSHPEDYTPVCTTELGAFAKLEPEFSKRGAKLIGLSANTLGSHEGWIKDIDEVTGGKVTFPIIADKERKIAYLYDMIDYQDTSIKQWSDMQAAVHVRVVGWQASELDDASCYYL